MDALFLCLCCSPSWGTQGENLIITGSLTPLQHHQEAWKNPQQLAVPFPFILFFLLPPELPTKSAGEPRGKGLVFSDPLCAVVDSRKKGYQ